MKEIEDYLLNPNGFLKDYLFMHFKVCKGCYKCKEARNTYTKEELNAEGIDLDEKK